MSVRDIAALLTLSVLWGGSFFFVEVLVDHFRPMTIVALRVGLAAIGLWGITLALRLPLPQTAQQWRALFTLSLLNNCIPFSLIAWGQTQISSGLASIFNATTPFFTVLVAGAFLADERITAPKIAGVLFGLLGTIVLIGPEVLKNSSGSVLGQFAVMAAAISYAFAGTYARRFKVWGLSPLIVAVGQVSMASLAMIPLALFIDQPWHLMSVPLTALGAVIGLAIASTVFGYILYFKLIESAGATNAALVTLLIPISAILLGVAFLNETFSAQQGAGMGLVATGLLIMDGRLFSYLKRLAS